MFSIGVYPAVSLADARQRRDEAKKLLASGIDPSAKKSLTTKRFRKSVTTSVLLKLLPEVGLSLKPPGRKIINVLSGRNWKLTA